MPKFVDIIRLAGNIGTQMVLGQPLFQKPDAPPLLPQNTSNKIIAAIAATELLTKKVDALKNLKGEEKLAMAVSLSKDAIMLSSALAGAEVEDQARFDIGASKITDGWNDIIKSVKQK